MAKNKIMIVDREAMSTIIELPLGAACDEINNRASAAIEKAGELPLPKGRGF